MLIQLLGTRSIVAIKWRAEIISNKIESLRIIILIIPVRDPRYDYSLCQAKFQYIVFILWNIVSCGQIFHGFWILFREKKACIYYYRIWVRMKSHSFGSERTIDSSRLRHEFHFFPFIIRVPCRECKKLRCEIVEKNVLI